MKTFLRILFMMFLVGNIMASNAQAEINIYEGVGEVFLSDKTLDYAKNKAKLNGMRNIAEKIFIKIQSSSEVKNAELVRDEIIAESESLIKIIEIRYELESDDKDNVLVKALVTAEVDTVEVERILKKFEEE